MNGSAPANVAIHQLERSVERVDQPVGRGRGIVVDFIVAAAVVVVFIAAAAVLNVEADGGAAVRALVKVIIGVARLPRGVANRNANSHLQHFLLQGENIGVVEVRKVERRAKEG